MPSVIPSGYVYWDGFGYVRESDRTGPYAISSSGTATLIGAGGGGGGGNNYVEPGYVEDGYVD